MTCRHDRQRRNRQQLKRDAAILLDRIAAMAELPPPLALEVAEMRLRLSPAPGVASPRRLTAYKVAREDPGPSIESAIAILKGMK